MSKPSTAEEATPSTSTMCFSSTLHDLPCSSRGSGRRENAYGRRCVIPVPLHWSYVWSRSTVAGGAITHRHGPSGLGHITWEDPSLSPPPVTSLAPRSGRPIQPWVHWWHRHETIWTLSLMHFICYLHTGEESRSVTPRTFTATNLSRIMTKLWFIISHCDTNISNNTVHFNLGII